MADAHKSRFTVDIPASIEPTPPPYPADPFTQRKTEYKVTMRSGSTVRVVGGKLGAAWLRLLQSLLTSNQPVAVVVEDGAVTDMRLPAIVTIARVVATAAGELEVHSYPSHIRRTLSGTNPDFESIRSMLIDLVDRPEPVAIIEDDNHDIIDIVAYRPPGDGPDVLPKPPQFLDRLRYTIDIWWHWLHHWLRWWCWIFCWRCRCVSQKKAWDLYNLVAAKSCNPVNPQPPCIPFLYPDDGCWGRAHEMCRLIVAEGVTPAKVWIHGSLHTLTRNNPYCFVNWGWHVAPTLCVRNWFCWTETWVIDPSLFPGPVTKATWKSVQGDPAATLEDTSWTVFHWAGYVTDPTFSSTNSVLATYRNALLYRSTVATNPNNGQLWGPPPYAHCP
jgi:hypothetical protein